MSLPVPVIFAAALAFHQPAAPKGYEPEAREDYEARLRTIATAEATIARNVEEAAAALTIISGESAFDLWVHAGLVHPDPRKHQDHFKARCLMQVHQNIRYAPDLEALGGTDLEATTACLTAGMRNLRSAAYMCTHGSMATREDMERVFAAYRNSGVSCVPTKQSIARAKLWETVRGRLWRAS